MKFLEQFYAENRSARKWKTITFARCGGGIMEEKKQLPALTTGCNIDKGTFFRFALYDSFIRKKAWRNPALFALIMSAFALVCFLGRERHEQAVLIGGVLLGVGLVLPLVWFGMFFASVNRQAKLNGLSPEKTQYTVTLSPEKIHVTKGKEAADFAWESVHLATRVKGCIYLYVSPTRAFLLPDNGQGGRAWELISAALDPARLRDRTT